MLLRKRTEELDPDEWRKDIPADELPPGFRLRRVGPGEWVAEPTRWLLWGFLIAVAGFCVGGVAGALMARSYYHRKATPLVISVNGVPMRQDELRSRLERRYGAREVEAFSTFELSRQFASARGCWPTEDEVAAAVEKERQKPDFLERFELQGLSQEAFIEEVSLDLAQTKLLIKDVEASPDEVLAFYRKNADPNNPAARYHSPARVQVTVVGTTSEEAARQCAREIAQGLPWKEAVARYSEHSSRRTGGVLPPFTRGESIFATNPQTEAAIFAMNPGDRLGPVPAARHWWVLRCEAKWGPRRLSWQEAREDAEIGARLAKAITILRSRLADEQRDFVETATIIISDPAYGSAQDVVLARPVRW